MADLAFLTVGTAFFAVCVVYVRALDRLVRSSSDGEQSSEGNA